MSAGILQTFWDILPWTAGSLKMVPTGCPATSVTNWLCTLGNTPEERISRKYSGGRLKSRTVFQSFSKIILQYAYAVLKTLCPLLGLIFVKPFHVFLGTQ